jgi:L-aminopeptidase/D-esterase-like protein
MGRRACDAASENDVDRGAVGAGTGATVGKLLGIAESSPGGVGIAEVRLPDGNTVAALAAVNAFGDVVDSETGRLLAGPGLKDGAFRSERALREEDLAASPFSGGHTTLVCVATTVPFDTGALKRVAIEAHDGIARAVAPAHTIVDGDVVFALSPGGSAPSLLTRLRVGAAAAHAVARAIADAVSHT